MRMTQESKRPRIDIFQLDRANIEIRLQEDSAQAGYRSWEMTRFVATLIALWWRYRNRDSEREMRFESLVIRTPSSGHIDVKELDNLGHAKAVGWLLPVAVVEAIGDKFP